MFGQSLVTGVVDCQLGAIPSQRAVELAGIANDQFVWINVRDIYPYPYTLAHANTFIQQVEKQENSIVWGIYYKDSLSGVIGLQQQSDVYCHNAELGYWLGRDFRGKGLASASVEAVVRFGFIQTNLERIYAGVFDGNLKSISVLLKNGFIHEATLRKAVFKNGRFVNELIFARLKN